MHFGCIPCIFGASRPFENITFFLSKTTYFFTIKSVSCKMRSFLQLYNKLLNSHPMHFRSIPSARKYSATKFRVSTDCWFAATQQQCYTPTPNGGALAPSLPPRWLHCVCFPSSRQCIFISHTISRIGAQNMCSFAKSK